MLDRIPNTTGFPSLFVYGGRTEATRTYPTETGLHRTVRTEPFDQTLAAPHGRSIRLSLFGPVARHRCRCTPLQPSRTACRIGAPPGADSFAPAKSATKIIGFARTVGVSSIKASNIRAIAIMTNAVETNRIFGSPLNWCDTLFSLRASPPKFGLTARDRQHDDTGIKKSCVDWQETSGGGGACLTERPARTAHKEGESASTLRRPCSLAPTM